MGQKLGAFLRVLGAGLSPQAFAAQTNEFAAMQAHDRNIESFGLKQTIANAGVLSAALKVEKDPEKRQLIIQNMKQLGEKIEDPRHRKIYAESVFAASQTPFEEKEAKAPKVINVKEGKDTVARQWNPKTSKYEEIARGQTGKGVTVNVGQEKSFNKELGKQFGRQIVERRKDAIDAKRSLESSQIAVDLLDEGVITGFGANFIVGFGKALKQAGLYEGEALANTEAYYANQAKQVANIIKAFGAGTGLSDADREYAEKAAAGKITMTEESLRKIIDINARASTKVINDFNADTAEIDKDGSLPFRVGIDLPEFSGAEKKDTLTDEEYEAKKRALNL